MINHELAMFSQWVVKTLTEDPLISPHWHTYTEYTKHASSMAWTDQMNPGERYDRILV